MSADQLLPWAIPIWVLTTLGIIAYNIRDYAINSEKYDDGILDLCLICAASPGIAALLVLFGGVAVFAVVVFSWIVVPVGIAMCWQKHRDRNNA